MRMLQYIRPTVQCFGEVSEAKPFSFARAKLLSSYSCYLFFGDVPKELDAGVDT